MTGVKVHLDKAMGTSLIMLYGLAHDARTTPSLLGDTVAAQALDKVDYDFARLKLSPQLTALAVTTRAKHFDDWTAQFLAAHEQATVVNLAAGLDSRVWRVAPGPGVTWYDVDYPDVVDVRSKIFPQRDDAYRLIGSSVTAPQWLQQIRPDLPTLVIAQGLTMYLQPEDGQALFRRITEHFARGVVILDTHNSYALRRQNKLVHRHFGATMHWAINGPGDVERAVPRLHCTDTVSGLALQGHAPGLPLAYKILINLCRHVPVLRDAGLYLRYEFGP
ncbi:class I SAM-dependent methyltransferase [Nonomuraea sp. NPDC050556]|uniref:class I SAM-dependent methyltransferase n=1 Tax=Nonomuraea sp. NPDC050556 TaxID=3364369 RepID=UPI00379BB507